VQALHDYGRTQAPATGGQTTFTPHPEANAFVINDPFAFLLAVIFDQGIPAERAWRAPYDLRERLGHLDPERPLAGNSTNEETAVMSCVSIIGAALTGSLPAVNDTVAPGPARAVTPCRVGVPVVGDTYAGPLSAARMFASAPITVMDFVEPVSGSTPSFFSSVMALSSTARATASCAATGMDVGV
jgi:hypothetical protein